MKPIILLAADEGYYRPTEEGAGLTASQRAKQHH